MGNVIEKIFRVDQHILKKYVKEAKKVLSLAEEMKKLSDDQLRAKTTEFKDRLKKGAKLFKILKQKLLLFVEKLHVESWVYIHLNAKL